MTQTLLLIDDDEISREVLALLLTPLLARLGVEMRLAADGEAALALLSEASAAPDAILLDAQLPGLSGVALVAALRRRVAAPILLFSASPVAPELAEAADGFLLKPAAPEVILAALQAARAANASKASVPARAVSAPAANAADCVVLPVIDSAVLAKFRLPAAALRSMYEALAEDCLRRMATLPSAIEARDAEAVRSTAHAIKGGCAMLGAAAMREAAAWLESVSQPADWPRDFAALEAAFSALRARLDDPAFDFAAPSG